MDMLTSKIFLRKTKRGKVIKVVREHYLRDDLWCGSDLCKKCNQENSEVLDDAPISSSTLCAYPHYVVVDTNVVLHQIDVLESPAWKNVILLQTVLEETRKRSTNNYKKLKEIMESRKDSFYVFVNEHHKDTYVERKPGESANDRNDRAIRKACSWYQTHLEESQLAKDKKKKVQVILLTQDFKNREQALKEGIPAFKVDEYVKSLKDFPDLQEKLAASHSEDNSENREPLFPEHWAPTRIMTGIKSGKLLQGIFHCSRENFLEGSVSVEGQDKSILLQGHASLNRAVDGDIVAVELLPEDKWTSPSGIVLEDQEDQDPGDQIEKEEALLTNSAKGKDRQPTGKIVGIIRRKWRQYCGILLPSVLAEGTRHLFVPAERKIPKIRIETRQAATLSSQKIIVAIDSWPRTSRYPLGHFVRALGNIGDKDTENEVLLLEHDVPHHSFPETVLACLPSMPWTISQEEVNRREDLRNLDICSVDPPGCTDIDDALHYRELSPNLYEVGVHIADVSHFVRPDTALDKEAANRGTTVYLVDRRIDMVPELLSSNLCSLRPDQERLAFSVIWEVTADAEIKKTRFAKSVIRSRRAFTYAEAQCNIDDPLQQNELAKSLRGLNKLAKIMKKNRMEKGALQLSSPEIRFEVSTETNDPIDVISKPMLDTNSMVEEFMLLANISVADHIFKHFPECAVLRRHPVPPASNFEPFLKAGKTQGFTLDVSSNKSLAASLDAAVKPNNPYMNTMLRILATRCMMQAVYFSSGTVAQADFYHYGLAAPIYTHFTSPIRRYADLLVHRLLAVAVGTDVTYAELLDRKCVQQLCNNLNYRHKMSQYAQRSSVALHTHLFFRHRVQDEDAYVLSVRQNALQVLIPKYGLEGSIYLKEKDDDSKPAFVYNPDEPSQTFGNITIRTFDRIVVQVSLDSKYVQHQKIAVHLVQPQIAGLSVEAIKTVNDSEPIPKKLKSGK
ncbi:exosome complex exonuclease RRP44-like [Daphnia carinata]|uniref:exosome complex exonuclease RRP44-like n=1 Tax=Daphnia carinata TaxID=120202 RepID=UPI00257EAD3D|nr:exosome complex exonuclease RRP44-like [Daphnia carinata]